MTLPEKCFRQRFIIHQIFHSVNTKHKKITKEVCSFLKKEKNLPCSAYFRPKVKKFQKIKKMLDKLIFVWYNHQGEIDD